MSVRVLIGRINVIALWIGWACLSVFAFFIAAAILIASVEMETPTWVDASLLIYSLIGLVGAGVIHLTLSYFVNCPQCGEGLTLRADDPHMNANGRWLKGRPFVAARWFTGTAHCIHCGAKVNTNTLEK